MRNAGVFIGIESQRPLGIPVFQELSSRYFTTIMTTLYHVSLIGLSFERRPARTNATRGRAGADVKVATDARVRYGDLGGNGPTDLEAGFELEQRMRHRGRAGKLHDEERRGQRGHDGRCKWFEHAYRKVQS